MSFEIDNNPENIQHLECCEECGGDSVYPRDWEQVDAPDFEGWWLEMRCPDCEIISEGVFDQDTVVEYDDVLNDQTEAIRTELKRLTQANMFEEIGRFTTALEADAVLPEDF